MKTGILLEELINIAQIPKTDFAISMNMTPSGLSKILTGRRLPISKEKKIFSLQAAQYFAEEIYGESCYLKFKNIFPIIYDFASKHELEVLLSYAIEHALDKDFAEENNQNSDYPDREVSFLGKKTVLNVLCVTLSDYVLNNKEVSLEFYSALPILNRVYYDILCRIKIIGERKKEENVFNHFVYMPSFEEVYMGYDMNILSAVVAVEKAVDFKLWEIEENIQSPFLFLKGQFLMIFSIQLDGKTPLMTLITNKGYLSIFFNSLMRQETKKSAIPKMKPLKQYKRTRR